MARRFGVANLRDPRSGHNIATKETVDAMLAAAQGPTVDGRYVDGQIVGASGPSAARFAAEVLARPQVRRSRSEWRKFFVDALTHGGPSQSAARSGRLMSGRRGSVPSLTRHSFALAEGRDEHLHLPALMGAAEVNYGFTGGSGRKRRRRRKTRRRRRRRIRRGGKRSRRNR